MENTKERAVSAIEARQVHPLPPEDMPTRDISAVERRIMRSVRPFTMTSEERIVSLINSVKFIVENKIEGGIVECGVWRGGSMMVVAQVLKMMGACDRDLYLFDTYQGMTSPGEIDRHWSGRSMLEEAPSHGSTWSYAPIDDVRRNLQSTEYPEELIHYVVGAVEDTLPQQVPEKLAIVRLDTDWYQSTKHELIHLFPRLSSGGILIIDDYGHYSGARKAVDEYFSGTGKFLHRIDYSGRLIVK